MSKTDAEARELAATAVDSAIASGADSAEAIVGCGTSALTRFAGNRIHQNVMETELSVSIRAVSGSKSGVASTNRIDPASIEKCCRIAVEAAKASPPDPAFPGLPEPRPVTKGRPANDLTGNFDETLRALAVKKIIGHSSTHGLTAAGGVSVTSQTTAVSNSLGVDVVGTVNMLRATVLSMGDSSGSGWASFVSADANSFDPDALGEEAARLAIRTKDPVRLDPGKYTVVLAPEAVADILFFLGWMTFGAKPYAEKRSAFSDRLGQLICDPSISIYDDAFDVQTLGLTFDYEGQPKTRVSLVEKGVAAGVVTDSFWAARTGLPNTGHALPAPNGYGPLPLNLVMGAGEATIEELISSVDRGVYITRFHYVNVEDPIPVTLTGMTRDGTFLIENGQLSRPLLNLRFTQSAIEALSNVRGLTSKQSLIGMYSGSPVLTPGLLIEKFAISGQTT